MFAVSGPRPPPLVKRFIDCVVQTIGKAAERVNGHALGAAKDEATASRIRLTRFSRRLRIGALTLVPTEEEP